MSLAVEGFKSSPFFDQLNDALKSSEGLKKDAIKKTSAVIIITLTNKESKTESWLLDLKSSGDIKKISDAAAEKSDVQLTLKDLDFKKLISGKANGQKLFMNGKLKVKGNMMKATAIETVLKAVGPKAKL